MFLSVARAETGGFNTAEAAVFFVGGCKLLPGVWEAGALWTKSGGTIAVTRSNMWQVQLEYSRADADLHKVVEFGHVRR